ncbi:hypothetical protein KCU93_g4211, partial [Aureobasidium melanogenum]
MSIVPTSGIPLKRKQIKTTSQSPQRPSKRARPAPGAYTIEHLSVGSEDSDFRRRDSPEMIANSSDDEDDNDDAVEDTHEEDAIYDYVSDSEDCMDKQHLGPTPTYSDDTDKFHAHASDGEMHVDGPSSHAATSYIGHAGGLRNYTTDDDLDDEILAAAGGSATLVDDESDDIDDYLDQPELNGLDDDNDDADEVEDDQISYSKDAHAYHQHAGMDGNDQQGVEDTEFVMNDARNIS